MSHTTSVAPTPPSLPLTAGVGADAPDSVAPSALATHSSLPASRAPASRAGGELLAKSTAEMARWTARLSRSIFPRSDHALARVLRMTFVTPLSHVAVMSFEFQCYLYAVFHRTRLARVVHILAMPVIVMAGLACLAQLSPLLLLLGCATLSCFYLMHAWLNRTLLLGAIMLPTTLAMGWAAHSWADVLSAGAPLWQQPVVWMTGLALAEAVSHALEWVPPRVNDGRDWVPIQQFFLGSARRPHGPGKVASRLLRASFMALAGTLNEILGAWRLLPIIITRALWALGYQAQRRERIGKLVRAALRDDNPAVDFIGRGGTRLHPLDALDAEVV